MLSAPTSELLEESSSEGSKSKNDSSNKILLMSSVGTHVEDIVVEDVVVEDIVVEDIVDEGMLSCSSTGASQRRS